jgi:glycosyltransferase involved in cell wall biosynthesis
LSTPDSSTTAVTHAGRRPVFSIVTPTFNRVETLSRAYSSLRAQTFANFEWVVVDDGSTDGTRDVVEQWSREARFPVRYIYQENAGKGAAENTGARVARGQFIVVLDSDDWLASRALDCFRRTWEQIPAEARDQFSGVSALSAFSDGRVVGSPFPNAPLDTDFIELVMEHRISGDKIGFIRTDVVRRFPVPEVEGERLPAESVVRAFIAQEYKVRCVNEILQFVEYRRDGLTAAGRQSFIASPVTARLIALNDLIYYRPRRLRERWRTHANHVRYSLHAKDWKASYKDDPSKLWWAAAAPLGVGAYVRDRFAAWRQRAQLQSSPND